MAQNFWMRSMRAQESSEGQERPLLLRWASVWPPILRGTVVVMESEFLHSRTDELVNQAGREWLIDSEVQRPFRAVIAGKVSIQLVKYGSAVRQVAQVILEDGEADHGFAAHLEGRYPVGDALLGVRNDRQDAAPQVLQRGALGFADGGEVTVDVLRRKRAHRRCLVRSPHGWAFPLEPIMRASLPAELANCGWPDRTGGEVAASRRTCG